MNKADKIPVFVIETLSSSNLSIQKPRLFQPSVRRDKDKGREAFVEDKRNVISDL